MPTTGKHTCGMSAPVATFEPCDFPLAEHVLAVSADGRAAVAANKFPPAMHLWHSDRRGSLRVSQGPSNLMSCCLALTPAGRLLLSGDAEHTLRLWDMWTGERICDLEGDTDTVWRVALIDHTQATICNLTSQTPIPSAAHPAPSLLPCSATVATGHGRL